MPVIQTLANDHLRVEIEANARVTVTTATGVYRTTDHAPQELGPIDIGHVWPRSERSLCEQFPSTFHCQLVGDAMEAEVRDELDRTVGTFRFRWHLDGADLLLDVLEISDSLPSLIFPPPFVSESVFLPRGQGKRYDASHQGRFFYTLFGHLTMRCFAGQTSEGSGWIGIWEAGHADSGLLHSGPYVSPGWLRSLGRWQGPRSLRYQFFRGGYVAAAKRFRVWAKDHGMWRSLPEKMEIHPRLKALVGGTLFSHMLGNTAHHRARELTWRPVADPTEPDGSVRVFQTVADVKAQCDARAEAGERGIVNVRGWIQGGYDESHPDIWPPEPAFGSVDELRELCQRPDPLPVVLHDNYQDIYAQSASFPAGIIENEPGQLMRGGFWAGGQAYILNPRVGLELAKRNWEEIAGLGAAGIFPDTVTAVRLYEDAKRGTTRADDELAKRELLEFYYNRTGLIGSEEAADFGVPFVDWFENRHGRKDASDIPFWSLVFGDAAFQCRYRQGVAANEPHPGYLTEMLWGFVPLVDRRSTPPEDPHRAGRAAQSEWQAKIAGFEMVGHVQINPEVETTEFANGASITVNFGAETAYGILPHSYLAPS